MTPEEFERYLLTAADIDIADLYPEDIPFTPLKSTDMIDLVILNEN
jgi:hypothetical protein